MKLRTLAIIVLGALAPIPASAVEMPFAKDVAVVDNPKATVISYSIPAYREQVDDAVYTWSGMAQKMRATGALTTILIFEVAYPDGKVQHPEEARIAGGAILPSETSGPDISCEPAKPCANTETMAMVVSLDQLRAARATGLRIDIRMADRAVGRQIEFPAPVIEEFLRKSGS